MKHKPLKAGDTRQSRDEQRRALPYDGYYQMRFMLEHGSEFEFGPVQLVGHKILQSDLMVFEYRRPLL